MEEEVAQAGDAGGVDAALRLDDVARRLGHLALVGQPVAVDQQPFGQFQAGRHEEGRPVDAVELEDVLAQHVHRRRPAVLRRRLFFF